MGALERHRAAVVEPPGQLQHLFQAVHPRPERRQLQAQRRELLGAPAGAEAGRHPLPPDEDGQLAELSQQQRGVDPRLFRTQVWSSSRSESPATAASVVIGSQPGSAPSRRCRPSGVKKTWSETATPVAPASSRAATRSRIAERPAVAAKWVSSTNTFTARRPPQSASRLAAA